MNLEQLYKVLVQQGLQIPFEEFAKLPQEQIQQLAEQVNSQTEPTQEQPTNNQEQMQEPIMSKGGRMKCQDGNMMNANNPSTMGNTTSKFSGLGNIAGQFGAGIAQTAGNMIASNSKPDQVGAFAGNMLGGAGQGAAAGMMFGPAGAVIGGGLGLVSGLVKSIGDKKNYLQNIKDRQANQVRHIGELTNSYNPQLKKGGYINRMDTFMSVNGKGVQQQGGNTIPYWNENKTKYQIGGSLPKLENGDNGVADAEIEGGEAVIGNPNDVTMYGGANAEHSSPVGFMANGANHGETNNAGTEGIPLMSNSELYIGSKKLGLNGKIAKRGNPSVATVMKPYLKYAAKASDSKDLYKKNPQALNTIQNELSTIQQIAEEGKFMEGLRKQVSNKNRNYQEVLNYIKQENPSEFGSNQQQDMQQQYKYGGIHIKPENRGKFNALKARTGKTTEELTHSPNPLTRKRAVFAQNAAKWHHADGGYYKDMYQIGGTIDNTGNPYTYKTAANGYEPYNIPSVPIDSTYQIIDNRQAPINQQLIDEKAMRQMQRNEAYDNAVQAGRLRKEEMNKANADRLQRKQLIEDTRFVNQMQRKLFPQSSMGLPKQMNGGRLPMYQEGGNIDENGLPLKQSFNDRMANEQIANTTYETNIPEISVTASRPNITTNNPNAYNYINNTGNRGIDESTAVDTKLKQRAVDRMGIAPSIANKATGYQSSYNPSAKVLEQYENEGRFDVTRDEKEITPDYDNIENTPNKTVNINKPAKSGTSQSHNSLTDAESSDPNNLLNNWKNLRTNVDYNKKGMGSSSHSRPEPLSVDSNGNQKFSDEVWDSFRSQGLDDSTIAHLERTPKIELYKNETFKKAVARDIANLTGSTYKNKDTDYKLTANQYINDLKTKGKTNLGQDIDDMIRDSNGKLNEGQMKLIQQRASMKTEKNVQDVSKRQLTGIDTENMYNQNSPTTSTQSSMNPGNKMTFAEAFAYAQKQNQPTFTFNGKQYATKRGGGSSTVGKGKTQGIVGNANTAGQQSTTTINNYEPKDTQRKEYKSIPLKSNGGTINLGDKVRFEHGGRMYSGKVNYYNPQTGDFDIE